MPETITFFPLDITYKIKNNKAVIYTYGKTADGTRLCVTDAHMQPYFYVQPKGNSITLASRLRTLKVPSKNDTAEVVDVQQVEKNFQGNKIQLLKVITRLPGHVPIIKEALEKNPDVQDCFEYDIPFAKRYLMDKSIVPHLGAKVTGGFVTGGFTADHSRVPLFEAEMIQAYEEEHLKDIRTLSFDIETYNPSNEGVQAEKYPILMVAFYGKDKTGHEFKKVITWKRFKTTKEYIEFVDGELELIERFRQVVEQYQPDIITGYYSDGFDFPYIVERARKHKINLDIGLDRSIPDISKQSNVVQINGLVHFDVFKFVRRVLGRSLETDVFTLEAVATELLGQHKHVVDLDALTHIWDNTPEDLEKYCEYNLHDAYITYLLCEKILPNVEELVKLIGLPLFMVSRMSFSRLVESYIMKQCPASNELIPNRPGYRDIQQRRAQTYQGAFVFQPTPGLYENVMVFDFRSLYPSIITSHNISPGSFQCTCCHDLIPGEKYWFCQKKKAFLPSVIENIITRRMRIKEIIKTSSEKNTLLDARSEALKVLANSFYGYLGFAPARWYHLESARSITALGRYYIHKVIDQAQKALFSVLYSDTDSIFMKIGNQTQIDAKKFVEQINTTLPGVMELDYEGFYPTALFVSAKAGPYGAKKKYALLSENGKLKIRGFESVRRNWSLIAKEVQEKVVETILKEKKPDNALAYVQQVITELRTHTLHLDKVTIYTQLQKPIEAYENVGPHVTVAKRMRERGDPVGPGSMIQFVVTTGKGIIRDRAKIPDEVKNNDYDVDYYLNNQIIPAVDRIFAVMGIDLNELINPKNQSTLGKFF